MNPLKWITLCSMMAAALAFAAGAAANGLEPAPVQDPSWMRLFTYQKDQVSVSRADLCFVGDSLTEYWNEVGRIAWEREFRGWRKVNCGISGDRAENILWRVQRLGLAKSPPRVVVLLAGTNNLAQNPPDSPEAVSATIARIVREIIDHTEETSVVVVSILPNGYEAQSGLRDRIAKTNEALASEEFGTRVEWLDCHDGFVERDGKWKLGLTVDGTHLSATGYQVLAEVLAPSLRRLLGNE
jgi:lysophospholipase L1-like esterase